MSGVGIDLETLFGWLSGTKRSGLAVSGGPDSLALMVLAEKWARDTDGPELIVYTVDHCLRPEAADEAAMVVREAERLGLAARLLRWEGDKPATGVMAAARAARYRLLAAAMAADGVEVMATAHHLGDQAETVLMRLAHGSGIEGLRGMDRSSEVEGCKVYRPLLGVRPEALAQVVADAGLTAAHDPSNLDAHYERVRWRNMLPQLEALGLSAERLEALARRMGEARDLIAEAAEDAWLDLVAEDETGLSLPHRRFAALNRQVGVTLLGQILRAVSGDRAAPSLGALETMVTALSPHGALKAVTLHGCVIVSDGKTIGVQKEGPRRAALKSQAGLTVN